MKYEKSLSFETILDALIKAVPTTTPTAFDSAWLDNRWPIRKRRMRQRDAFRARLIAIYQQQEELKGEIKHWQQMYNVCDDLFWEQLRKLCEILDVPFTKTSFEKALALVKDRLTKY